MMLNVARRGRELTFFFKKVTRVLLKSVLLFSVVLSCGLGSSMVQLVAWTSMFSEHLGETGDVAVAVENTFDGNHACSMCQIASEMRELEASPEGKIPKEPSERKQLNLPKQLLAFSVPFRFHLNELEASSGLRGGSYMVLLLSREKHVETPPPQCS